MKLLKLIRIIGVQPFSSLVSVTARKAEKQIIYTPYLTEVQKLNYSDFEYFVLFDLLTPYCKRSEAEMLEAYTNVSNVMLTAYSVRAAAKLPLTPAVDRVTVDVKQRIIDELGELREAVSKHHLTDVNVLLELVDVFYYVFAAQDKELTSLPEAELELFVRVCSAIINERCIDDFAVAAALKWTNRRRINESKLVKRDNL